MPISGEFEQIAKWSSQQLHLVETRHTAWKILTPIRWALTDLEEAQTVEHASKVTKNIWNSLPDAVVSITVSPDITVSCATERLDQIPDDKRIHWNLLQVDEYAERIAKALNTTWERTVTEEE